MLSHELFWHDDTVFVLFCLWTNCSVIVECCASAQFSTEFNEFALKSGGLFISENGTPVLSASVISLNFASPT